MPLLSCVVSLKTRIVRILFSCMLPQTDNCCPTTVYRHLQCMSLWIDVSGVLRRHYTIESFYDRKLWFLLWCLSLFLSLNSCFFIVYFRYILECDILWMYLFLPYCVRKWHNKTVQSIKNLWKVEFLCVSDHRTMDCLFNGSNTEEKHQRSALL